MCPDGNDSGVWSSLHCEGQDSTVVDIEGVERPHSDLCSQRVSGQLEQGISLPFSHADSVLPEDAI